SGRKRETARKQILQRQIVVIFHPPGPIARSSAGTKNRRDMTAAFEQENSRPRRELIAAVGKIRAPFRHRNPFIASRPGKKCLTRGVKSQTGKTKIEGFIATRLAITGIWIIAEGDIRDQLIGEWLAFHLMRKDGAVSKGVSMVRARDFDLLRTSNRRG